MSILLGGAQGDFRPEERANIDNPIDFVAKAEKIPVLTESRSPRRIVEICRAAFPIGTCFSNFTIRWALYAFKARPLRPPY